MARSNSNTVQFLHTHGLERIEPQYKRLQGLFAERGRLPGLRATFDAEPGNTPRVNLVGLVSGSFRVSFG